MAVPKVSVPPLVVFTATVRFPPPEMAKVAVTLMPAWKPKPLPFTATCWPGKADPGSTVTTGWMETVTFENALYAPVASTALTVYEPGRMSEGMLMEARNDPLASARALRAKVTDEPFVRGMVTATRTTEDGT